MAGSNSASNGSAPKRSERAGHAATAPGTVTDSQPKSGMRSNGSNCARRHARGERPELLRPVAASPSHTMANASLPMPFIVGSTTVRAIAVATAASIAFPPCLSIERPACAARGCEVATTFRANTGIRWEQYGNDQSSRGIADRNSRS